MLPIGYPGEHRAVPDLGRKSLDEVMVEISEAST